MPEFLTNSPTNSRPNSRPNSQQNPRPNSRPNFPTKFCVAKTMCFHTFSGNLVGNFVGKLILGRGSWRGSRRGSRRGSWRGSWQGSRQGSKEGSWRGSRQSSLLCSWRKPQLHSQKKSRRTCILNDSSMSDIGYVLWRPYARQSKLEATLCAISDHLVFAMYITHLRTSTYSMECCQVDYQIRSFVWPSRKRKTNRNTTGCLTMPTYRRGDARLPPTELQGLRCNFIYCFI